MKKKQKKTLRHVSKAEVVKAIPVSRALVMSETALAPAQQAIINARTPGIYVLSKPGRGGKKVHFVQGGYVISKLNEAFSPLGWEFEIVEHGTTKRKNEKSAEGEVWVRGKLTIVDHKNGYRVSKTQFGQHPIHEHVPTGDALKSAGTDALKKCASMLGIALDVYWGQLDEAPRGNKGADEPKREATGQEIYDMAKKMIPAAKTSASLFAVLERVKESTKLTKTQKYELERDIGGYLDKLEVQQDNA